MSGTPKLSVVIIGRNEGERLLRCLDSVAAMNDIGGMVQVIYVDSNSTDDSVEKARARGAEVLEVKPERPAAAIGRNAGWKAASAPIVLFLDGDTILDPTFVAESLRHFEDPQVAIVWGHRREIDTAGSLYNRVLDLDWVYPPGESEFCGGDALMRRSVLEEVGGYDDTLIAGEEPEMCRRIRTRGYTILHVDHPMTGHDLAMTRFKQYWKRAFRAGHAYAEVAERFRGTDMPLWEDHVRRNFRRGLFFLSTPLVALALSLGLKNPWPFVALLGLFALLALRTATKVGWKSRDLLTRLLYGLHSHFQQVPIFFGQLSFRRDRRAGRRRMLIDYKEAPR